MPRTTVFLWALGVLACAHAGAQTYFFVGPAGGDFFNESNWNTIPNGLGSSIPGNPLLDSSTNAIALDLVIDGDTVEANGQVDFGTGSLTLTSGSALNVTGAGNDLDINADSTFSLTNATLAVDDVINFEGDSRFSGGLVSSLTDDIAFQDNFVNLSIDGTLFNSGDNIYFDGFTGSIANATFISADRFGLRNNVGVVVTDTSINISAGQGDVDDIFAAAALGSSLTLRGNSNLVADSVEEGAALVIDDVSIATLGGQGIRVVTADSKITLASTTALLSVRTLDPGDIDFVDARPFLVNGLTGLSYADDPSAWNISNWNGSDAVTLAIASGGRPIPGDADGDGDVDLDDFNILAANFGLTGNPGGASVGDFNGDTNVDLADFNILAANFGIGTESVGALPEPGTAVLIAVGGLVSMRRRA